MMNKTDFIRVKLPHHILLDFFSTQLEAVHPENRPEVIGIFIFYNRAFITLFSYKRRNGGPWLFVNVKTFRKQQQDRNTNDKTNRFWIIQCIPMNVSLFMCIFQSESFKDWFSCDKKMVFMQLKTAALGFVY